MQTETVNCKRCGRKCQPGTGNPNSRPFRRAIKGNCVHCAITIFLKTTDPVATLLRGIGVKAFYNPDIQDQISAVMKAGNCDARIEEIDWKIVIANWDMPI